MNVYKLLQLNRKIKSHRIKFLGLYLLHKLDKRYMAVNLDPVMACNLRCKMCYFTDKDYVKTLKGQLKTDEVERIAEVIFPRALKLQIGCGTEPTLYKNLPHLIALGKYHKVPYISLTTNANLLTEPSIRELLEAGLDEFTISLHGVHKESYEEFMGKADYDIFQNVFKNFRDLKEDYNFKVRVNYTFNEDNFFELKDLFQAFNPNSIDILQIRPIQNLGNTAYQNFSLAKIKNDYDSVLEILQKQCIENEVLLMAPKNLEVLEKPNDSSLIFDYTYCYVSPNTFFRPDFNWRQESFPEYAKRVKWSKQLLANVFKSKNELKASGNRLNYEVNFN